MSKQDKIKAYKYYLKRCQEEQIDYMQWDFEAEIDTTLSYSEIVSYMEDEVFNKLTDFEANIKQEKINAEVERQHYKQIQDAKNQNCSYNVTSLFDKPKIISICANINEGKSMLIYHIIEELQKIAEFNLYTYGLKCKVDNSREIFSIKELEMIENSIIIIDEFFNLFDVDDRKNKKMVENSLRLINHKNNILVLCGVGENFKKFISRKINTVIFKTVTYGDLINGSGTKEVVMNYNGMEAGSTLLNLPIDEAIVYDGKHYNKIKVPYYEQYDSKLSNPSIFKIVPKSVPKIMCKKNVQ